MSRQKIINSFLELIKVKTLDKITITEIMVKSHVTRTYFYQFFDDKADLAQEAFFDLFAEMFNGFSNVTVPSDKQTVSNTKTGISFAVAHRQEMSLLLSFQGRTFNLSDKFQHRIKTIIAKELAVQYRDVPLLNRDFFAELYAASAIATLNWMLSSKDDINVNTIVSFIDKATFQGMTSILEKS